MDIKAIEQAEQARKTFKRRYFLKEGEEAETDPQSPPMDDSERKQAWREKQYESGWINFSVTVPKACAAYLKKQYESYKESNASAFTDGPPDDDINPQK